MEDMERQRLLAQYKANSQTLCNRMINDLTLNKDEAEAFFGGEIYRAYVKATEAALQEANAIKRKINRL